MFQKKLAQPRKNYSLNPRMLIVPPWGISDQHKIKYRKIQLLKLFFACCISYNTWYLLIYLSRYIDQKTGKGLSFFKSN